MRLFSIRTPRSNANYRSREFLAAGKGGIWYSGADISRHPSHFSDSSQLKHGQSTIDSQFGTGDECSVIGGQESDAADDVIGDRPPPEREFLFD